MSDLQLDIPLQRIIPGEDHGKARIDAVLGNSVFVFKAGIRNVRDLHAAVIEAAFLAVLDLKPILVFSRLQISEKRFFHELDRTLLLLDEKIRKALNIVIYRHEQQIKPSYGKVSGLEISHIPEIAQHHIGRQHARKRRGFAFDDTLSVLLIHWFRQSGPRSLKSLGSEIGISYPTLSEALDRLEGHLVRSSNRSVMLKAFPSEHWPAILLQAPAARQSEGYRVRDGQARSPETLLKRTLEFVEGRESEEIEIAIGGTHAARHYLPGIDLVGTPRLDLTLYLADPSEKKQLLRHLDPALRPVERGETPQIVLNHLDRPRSFFQQDQDGNTITDEVETLLDLHAMRFDPQAQELLQHLIQKMNS